MVDFSKGQRGRFYRPNTELVMPNQHNIPIKKFRDVALHGGRVAGHIGDMPVEGQPCMLHGQSTDAYFILLDNGWLTLVKEEPGEWREDLHHLHVVRKMHLGQHQNEVCDFCNTIHI